MSRPQHHRSPSGRSRSLHLPVTTWVGIAGTALLALIGLAAGGFWSMVLMVSVVVLLTAVYGALFHRTTWLRLPKKRTSAAIGAAVAFVVLIGSSSAYGAAHPETTSAHTTVTASSSAAALAKAGPSAKPRKTAAPTPTPTPVVTTKTVTETLPIPFATSTVQSASMASGTSSVTTVGANGVETTTWTVSFTDGVETKRTLASDVTTTPPVTQVTTVGTYVAPPPPAAPTCTNGTYVNTAGNTVCRPEVSPNAPSGATAKCGDGTYSFSQSRRGTCSSHGGVADWL
ncbi:DUF3761 domain-containing protein [Curtobacterium sp. PhB136]|uniref:DUF3761 domain-containing protein n=1 Tax=Curtobacterium sp. PhB136 TaxID=2485181 RepID=UPI00105334D2|nr:DUF3761 domain-containing protein [Curtobacterium sp. PhB136]TCK64583.1 surface rod structure-forming protein G [Curtobacterium sp. PhB136]